MTLALRVAIALALPGTCALAAGLLAWTSLEQRSTVAAIALGVGVLGALACAPLAAMVSASLSRGLASLGSRVDGLAAGDIAAVVPVDGPSDVAVVARSLEHAIVALRSALVEVRSAETGARASVSSLVERAAEYASTSEEQAAAADQVSSTVARLSSAAHLMAEAAVGATQAAAAGRAAVDDTARGVESILQAIRAAVERARPLESGSVRVAGSTDAINAIAERTHVLALNAAIEAASAGEHGRRFAAIAGQVRELAGDTRQATEDVKVTIGEFRAALASLEESANLAEQVAARVDEQARRAASAIGEVVSIVETIARVALTQHGASAELTRTMDELAEAARSSAATARQAGADAQIIDQAAVRIRAVIDRFRLATST